MKLNYVVLNRVKELIPKWLFSDYEAFATILDETMTKHFESEPFSMQPKCWIELDVRAGKLEVKIKEPHESVDNTGMFVIFNYDPIIGSTSQIELPLYSFFMSDKEMLGQHTVYMHGIQADVPLYYIGLTKQNWYARFNQHLAAARSGSHYIFHRALREHSNKPMVHKLLVYGFDFDNAMREEENWVGEFSLYPLGLNMIPGGFAGFKYLGSLGYKVGTEKQRSHALMEIIKLSDIKGRPNPLCAARWASDQDFINRVICGHKGRLTVDQVRTIRRLSEFGEGEEYISKSLGVFNIRQIIDVIRGKYYSRVS